MIEGMVLVDLATSVATVHSDRKLETAVQEEK